ncbi:Imm26 family immunity protein [Ralstonia solanacearum species complex bacterium KE056]|uniref:Imm26 family immunity protein n=1 Tax=Ralstonia solanacearum species complex bacterium KE056 TaxID=3119585 RepID=UPI002FC2CCC4
MKTPPTNLVVLKKTRRKPEAGDIFAFQLEQLPDRYFFGRVVDTDTKIGNVHDGGVILIYLYKATSDDKTKIPDLHPSDLLVPPIGTNDRAWMRGFFEVVRSGLNSAADLLPQHCFRDSRGWFFDEHGNRLFEAVEPVGVDGVSGIGSIDHKISKALGLPLKEEASPS